MPWQACKEWHDCSFEDSHGAESLSKTDSIDPSSKKVLVSCSLTLHSISRPFLEGCSSCLSGDTPPV